MNNFFLAITLLLALTNHAQANNQFNDFFNSFDRLSANFKQTTHNEFGALINTSSGTLTFSRPRQLRWHTMHPNEQILLLNHNELWLVDVELEQATLQKTTDLSKTPLYWLVNKPDRIKNTPVFSHTEQGTDWYKTTQENTLYFGFDNNTLSAISLKNELDQKVLVVLDQVTINPSIDTQVFKLNLDPLFDVIR